LLLVNRLKTNIFCECAVKIALRSLAFFSPKCTNYRLEFRLCLDPRGNLQCSPGPLAGFKGPTGTFEERKEEEGKGRGEKGVGREGEYA